MKFGRTISIGSKATKTATQKAEAISLGRRAKYIGSYQEAAGRSAQIAHSKSLQTTHRGSGAGLQNGRTVRLKMNGTGYDNPANQIARYRPRAPQQVRAQFNNNMYNRDRTHSFSNRIPSFNKSSASVLTSRIGRNVR